MERRIESALAATVGLGQGGAGAPSRLSQALGHAVFPGGARIRPTILMSVALACGDDRPELTDAAAAALELIHCASLVHDDLPCFDDADLRRGKPSVHRAFGQPVAVLAGDSLIVMAFQTLARAAARDPARAIGLVGILAEHTGMPGGICAGQGWESEPKVDLSAYHRAKTGSLFVAATRMGALASGQDDEHWVELGARIGEAFQVADDLRDALLSDAELGKPAGQDAVHSRPSAVLEFGVEGAIRRLQDILSGAIASIPSCPGEASLAGMVRRYADKMVPAADRRPVTQRSAAAGS
jgi:geranylgeranyl diphosphate synthase type II